MIHRQHSSSKAKRHGTTVTELAVVLPVVLIVLLGIIDLAQAIYAFGTVSEAARAGARYAIVHGANSAAPTGPTANNTTVASIVTTNAPALDPARLSITSSWSNGNNDPVSPVTVTVTYTCMPCLGSLVGFGNFNVSGSTTMLITH